MKLWVHYAELFGDDLQSFKSTVLGSPETTCEAVLSSLEDLFEESTNPATRSLQELSEGPVKHFSNNKKRTYKWK